MTEAEKQEILEMVERDQAARNENPIDIDKAKSIDTHNTARIKELLEKYGWPRISEVGQAVATTVWLLVQHADADPAFQRQGLDMMTALPLSEVRPQDLALMTDRVLVKETGNQRYGSLS